MVQRPRIDVAIVPPCALTIPAALLLAPSPALLLSITTTEPAPLAAAKYEAQPPTVPAPITTRSARPSAMPFFCAPSLLLLNHPVLSRPPSRASRNFQW